MILLLIILWLMGFLTFGLGFLMGYIKFIPDSQENIKKLLIEYKHKMTPKPKTEVGAVLAPTPVQNWLKKHPETLEEDRAGNEAIQRVITEEGITILPGSPDPTKG